MRFQIILVIYLGTFLPKNSKAECPKTPSYHGNTGPTVKNEIDCALACKTQENCFSYLYKDFANFSESSNTYSRGHS